MPKVSVIMAAYNAEPYVAMAVDSVLRQTYTDFEFIVIDDGSNDRTWSILSEYDDSRLICIRNPSNLGLTRTLNRGLELAQGEYIARQDADDLSLPHRLLRQVQALDLQPAIGLLGTWWLTVDASGQGIQHVRVPTDSHEIVQRLPVDLVVTHATVMVRRSCLDAVGHYCLEAGSAEDLDLWLRIAEQCQISNVPEELYHVRVHGNSVVGSGLERHLESICCVLKSHLKRWEHGSQGVMSTRTIARCYVRLACQDFMMDRIKDGIYHLMMAAAKDPSIAQYDRQIETEIANFALYACKLAQPQREVSLWRQIGSVYIEDLVNHLPDGWRLDTSNIYARFLATASYASYIERRFADAVIFGLSAMRSKPLWAKNRGLWAVVVNSALRRRIVL